MASEFFVQASEFLPDERLRELAKCADLAAVHHITFTVDTSENSLGNLGHRLPALRQLRLSGSNISTLRDLGTGLGELRVLWLARSSLRELEGIGAFGALTELYLSFNDVEDLSPLMGADQLQVLDLEANAIADVAQVHYLQGCDQLHSLTLDGNPIAESVEYRASVLEALPQLQFLDDVPTDGSSDEAALVVAARGGDGRTSRASVEEDRHAEMDGGAYGLGPLDEAEAAEAAKAAAANALSAGRGKHDPLAAETAEFLEELYRYKLSAAAAGAAFGPDGASSSSDDEAAMLPRGGSGETAGAGTIMQTAMELSSSSPVRRSRARVGSEFAGPQPLSGPVRYGGAVGDEVALAAGEDDEPTRDEVLLLDVC